MPSRSRDTDSFVLGGGGGGGGVHFLIYAHGGIENWYNDFKFIKWYVYTNF